MRQGIVGFLILILGIAILAVLLVTIQSKLLSENETNKNVDLGSEQLTPNSTKPRDVQKKVNDLQNTLQQKQNESLGVE